MLPKVVDYIRRLIKESDNMSLGISSVYKATHLKKEPVETNKAMEKTIETQKTKAMEAAEKSWRYVKPLLKRPRDDN
jgi:hypothetical protein